MNELPHWETDDGPNFPGPTHLIIAIEASGSPDHVHERIDRAVQVVQEVAEERNTPLRCSLISYGPHAVSRAQTEVPVTVLAWAGSSKTVLAELTLLSEQEPAPLGYRRAAQLECLLTRLAECLSGTDGRPVLVSIGSRPAFPARMDARSEIIPCPLRNDWRRVLTQLRTIPGIAFGAISDHGRDEEIWSHLGREALSGNILDLPRFTANLGLSRIRPSENSTSRSP